MVWYGAKHIDGIIDDSRILHKFGRNADIDTATDPEDVWTAGGIWVAPTESRIHDIVSGSANDTALGSGARTLQVEGVGEWSDPGFQSEIVTLNGATPVPTRKKYSIIHRMRTLTSGANGINAGLITATAQTDGTVTAEIVAGENQTLMAIWGMPAGKKLYVHSGFISIQDTGTQSARAAIYANTEPDENLLQFRVAETIGIATTGTSAYMRRWYPPLVVNGPAIIKAQVQAVANNDADISAGFGGVIADQ